MKLLEKLRRFLVDNRKMKRRNRKVYIFGVLFLFCLFFLAILFINDNYGLSFSNDRESTDFEKQQREQIEAVNRGEVSPFSGLPCQNYNRRPVAVMLSGDAVTRPLSGFNEADLVVNMPVITDSITRFMAVYVCGSPKEIGSIRSARDDFIPLVQGWDAIYAHWGGSHFALEKLDQVDVDNLDALPNYGNAFYRKAGIAMPHNGFTSMSRLLTAAKKIGYDLTGLKNIFFKHLPITQDFCQAEDCQQEKTLQLGFSNGFGVYYKYKPQENSYSRFRSGSPEVDKNDGLQVSAKAIVVMRVESEQIEGQYNDVGVVGSGQCQIYQNGLVQECRWQKKSETAVLKFYNHQDKEIEFVPGQIWIEMVQINQEVEWN